MRVGQVSGAQCGCAPRRPVGQLPTGGYPLTSARPLTSLRRTVMALNFAVIFAHGAEEQLCLLAQVDNTTFATVLELCEGGDLEGHLQQFHVGGKCLSAVLV